MKQTLVILLSLAVLSTCAVETRFTATAGGAVPAATAPSPETRAGLRFERNAGQFAKGSLFGVRSGPQAVAFGHDGIEFAQADGSVGVRMRWLGGSTHPDLVAEEQSAGVANYLYGPDPSTWRTNVELFRRIRYRDVYPGIDLVFYDRDGQLEYDFVVEPGVDPDDIAVTFDRADSVRLSASGDLAVAKEAEVHAHKAPVVYQDVEGDRQIIDSRFDLSDDGVLRFDIADHDATETLVIDPGIVFSTLLGGGLSDSAGGVATDSKRSLYVTGWTTSLTFPVRNSLFPYNPGGLPDGTAPGDCFVTKFTRDGSDIVFSTYIGGSRRDEGTAIAVGPDGAIYVAGTTWSDDFPTVHPLRTNHDVTSNAYSDDIKDPFVFKLSANGTALLYSSYLGGSRFDEANSIVVDQFGAAIVSGITASLDLLTTSNAFQATDPNTTSPTRTEYDGFLSKIDPNGLRLEYSTYVGANNSSSSLLGMTLAPNGDILVTGRTGQLHFLPGVLQSEFGPRASGDVFVVAFTGDTGFPRWVSVLGGTSFDEGRDIAVDPEGSVYVAGYTYSRDLPTVLAIQPPFEESFRGDAFLFKLEDDGTTIAYSTYLGGTDNDMANALVVDTDGSAIVAGETDSLDFPVAHANLPFPYRDSSLADGFVSKVSPSGTVLQQSTFLGGRGSDSVRDLALLRGGDVAVVGYSGGSEFPVWRAFLGDSYDGSSGDGFVMRLRFSPIGPSPVISKVKGRRDSGDRPGRGRITGSGFKPGAIVYAGSNGRMYRFSQTRTKIDATGTEIIVTDVSLDLKSVFHGNGDHTVIVTNPDGGQAILKYEE